MMNCYSSDIKNPKHFTDNHAMLPIIRAYWHNAHVYQLHKTYLMEIERLLCFSKALLYYARAALFNQNHFALSIF